MRAGCTSALTSSWSAGRQICSLVRVFALRRCRFRACRSATTSATVQIALDGYYRLTLDAGGSNAYVGAGAEYQFLAFDTLVGAVGLHALAGLEWRLSRNFGLFIEATPGVLLQPPALAFTVIVRSGLVLRF